MNPSDLVLWSSQDIDQRLIKTGKVLFQQLILIKPDRQPRSNIGLTNALVLANQIQS